MHLIIFRGQEISTDPITFFNFQVPGLIEHLFFLEIALTLAAEIEENPFPRDLDNDGFDHLSGLKPAALHKALFEHFREALFAASRPFAA